MLFHPREERAGIVQAEAHAGMFFQQFDKWKITVLIRFFENVAKIATGLMRVNQEDEMEIRGHEGGSGLHLVSYPAVRACRIGRRRASANARLERRMRGEAVKIDTWTSV